RLTAEGRINIKCQFRIVSSRRNDLSREGFIVKIKPDGLVANCSRTLIRRTDNQELVISDLPLMPSPRNFHCCTCDETADIVGGAITLGRIGNYIFDFALAE